MSIPPEPVFNKGQQKSEMAGAFGMNPKVGGSSPPQVETFSVSKTLTFHKNIRSCIENECCCARTVNISNVNFTSIITSSFST